MYSPTDSLSELLQVKVELIDTSTWRPLNRWAFEGKRQITIGRSPDRDVAISDPVVSREHASLVVRNGKWYLTSTGRHGVLILDKLISEHIANSGLVFRLGAQGPTLKFTVGGEQEDSNATFNFDEAPALCESVEDFELDKDKLRREVTEIAESDYFRELQTLAEKMRAKRSQRHD